MYGPLNVKVVTLLYIFFFLIFKYTKKKVGKEMQ